MALAITSILGLSVMSMMNTQLASLNYVERKMEKLNLERRLLLLLENNVECANVFQGLQASSQKLDLSDLLSLGENNEPSLASILPLDPKSDSKILVDSVQLTDVQPVPGLASDVRKGVLQVNFADSENRMGPMLKPLRIEDFLMKVDSANRIVACRGSESDSSSTSVNAGKSCPEGYMVVGFDQQGAMICSTQPTGGSDHCSVSEFSSVICSIFGANK